MWEIKINREEIKMMKELDKKKSIGPNGISGYILKDYIQDMAEPIHGIIKCSLKTGKVPKEWKRVDLMPIYKNGNKEEPLNHKPVSLTNIVCKICEESIKKQWTEYSETE